MGENNLNIARLSNFDGTRVLCLYVRLYYRRKFHIERATESRVTVIHSKSILTIFA